MQSNKSKPFMLDNAYYTMASFMGLRSSDFNVQNNLFSIDHIDPTRVVYSKNYDKDMNTSIKVAKKHKEAKNLFIKTNKEMKLLK